MRHMLGFIVILMLLGMSCTLTAGQSDDAPSAGSDLPTSLPGMELYVDNNVGFAFNYPAGWTVAEPPPVDGTLAYTITMASYDFINFTTDDKTEGVPLNASKIEFFVMPADQTGSLDQMRERMIDPQGQGEQQATVLDEQPAALADGTPAIRLWVQDIFGAEATVLLTTIKGRGISVTGYGDLAHFEQVINTLRPLG